MNEFARLSAAERELYFEQTASRMNLPAHLIEKDYWVCFSLGVLFSLQSESPLLTFKGGTSLSKVYRVIERFSEDIDFAVNRQCLGFGADSAPDAEGISGEERKRRLSALTSACLAMVKEVLFPKLSGALRELLGETEWSLDLNEDENQNQVLYFRYPPTGVTVNAAYNPPHVRLELTARTDDHPSIFGTVTPYVAEQFPDAIEDAEVTVAVLAAERTFWEKATILHQFHFQEKPERVVPGFSRHYYDIHQLAAAGISEQAVEQIALLPEVADHKNVFYRQVWARYDLARSPQTLELLPHENIASTIQEDYEAMGEMMFGSPPDFDEIVETLTILKQRINAIGVLPVGKGRT